MCICVGCVYDLECELCVCVYVSPLQLDESGV